MQFFEPALSNNLYLKENNCLEKHTKPRKNKISKSQSTKEQIWDKSI